MEASVLCERMMEVKAGCTDAAVDIRSKATWKRGWVWSVTGGSKASKAVIQHGQPIVQVDWTGQLQNPL